MTWWFDPSGGTFDAYDHNGDLVAEDRAITDSWGRNHDGQLVTVPQDFFDVMAENLEGSQPSAYNQQLIADAATKQVDFGTPP